MSTLTIETQLGLAQNVEVTDDTLSVDLTDGRTISVPLAWYPRLQYANKNERNNWRLTANGEGIHWNDIDEDLSVENIILGQPSGESQRSFQKWLEKREK
jgi:hypothetical protein